MTQPTTINTIVPVSVPSVPALRAVLAARGAVLSSGSHGDCEGACCALEAVALVKLSRPTDNPGELDMPDLRSLNDAAWSSAAVRTEHMLPVIEALFDYPSWNQERRVRFARALALKTVQQVLPIAFEAIGLSDHAKACREATTLDAAAAAAAAAAADADADALLTVACKVWVESAFESISA